jgi:phage/plasmid-associated DNA primase
MSSDTRDTVLRMVNHVQDKTIKELAAHITDIKQGLEDLRGSDLRSLTNYIFSVEVNDNGFLDNVGNDFHKKIHGVYTQHMIGMSAVESRFHSDAKDMADEASMDIRIIRNTIDKVYKYVCQLHSLQETLLQPMLADAETSRTIEDSDDLNPYQVFILDILNELERQKLRKSREMVCEEVITEKGYRTKAWKPVCTIKEKIHEMSDKNTSSDRWKYATKKPSMVRDVSVHLEECNDVQFPSLTKNRHSWSFRNGVFVGDIDGMHFYRYGTEEFSKLDRHMVTSKYFDDDFDDYTGSNDWREIPTPLLDSIMDYQGWDDEVKRWAYIMIGRLTFKLNEADTWQVIPFCKGIAQSGKSTLLNYVVKLFYEPSDVSVMANNIEEKFGLSSIYQANLFIGPEIKHDFRIDQAEFQSLISGEEIQIARKNKNAVTIQWDVPGILAGNETPGFSDNSGSILRRLMLFKFGRQVSDGDARLGEKLAKEIGAIMQKCIWAYIEAVAEYGDKLIWKVVPKQFLDWREEIEGQLHTLVGFMKTTPLKYGEDKQMPLAWFRTKYREYCSSMGVRPRQWKTELYEGPFSQRKLRIGVGTMEWMNVVKKDQEILYGVTMVQDDE